MLDTHTQQWWGAESLAAFPVGTPWDVRSEIRVVYETEPIKGAYIRYTRGMVKLGLHELVLTWPDGEDLGAAELLYAAAAFLAGGATLTPGEPFTAGGKSYQVSTYLPGANAPELHLNHPALLLSGLT